MASPVVAGVTEGGLTAAGTSVAVTLPGSGAASDEWIIIMSIGSTAATLNALTDWTELLDENSAIGLKIVRYTGAGVPSNPTFTTSASTRTVWIAYRITGADKTVTPQIGSTSSGTSATPDPPASASPPSSKDYLFIAFAGMAGEEADDDTWGNTPPTNYTPSPPRQKSGGTSGTNIGGLIVAAERQLTTGAAENPGTFGVDVSAAWRAQTITVHPLASTAHTHTQPDSVTGTDARTARAGKTQADSGSLADAIGRVWAATKALGDTAAATDATARATTSARADTATVTDSVQTLLARSHTYLVDDSIAAADATGKAAGKAQADAVLVADAVAMIAGVTFADALSLVDDVVRDSRLTLTDMIATADAVDRTFGMSQQDGGVVGDGAEAGAGGGAAWTLDLAETFTATDSVELDVLVYAPPVGVWTYGPFQGWQYAAGTAFVYTGGTAFTYGG